MFPKFIRHPTCISHRWFTKHALDFYITDKTRLTRRYKKPKRQVRISFLAKELQTNLSFSKNKNQLLRKEIGVILTCHLVFLYLRVNLVLLVMKNNNAYSVKQRWEIHVGCLINLGNICVTYIRSIKTNQLLFLRIIIKLIFLNLVSFFKIISKVFLKMILQYCFH